MYPNGVSPQRRCCIQESRGFPKVFRVQRRAVVNGQLHLRNGCAVLED